MKRDAENYQLSPEFAAVPKPVDPFAATAIPSEIPLITPDASPQATVDPGPPPTILDAASQIQCVTEFAPGSCVFTDRHNPIIFFGGQQALGIETDEPTVIAIPQLGVLGGVRLIYEDEKTGKDAEIDLPFKEGEKSR